MITMSMMISGELLEKLTDREVTMLRAGWPFEEESLRAYAVRGLITKFEQRGVNLAADTAWIVEVAVKSGKRALIFFPSYKPLARLFPRLFSERVAGSTWLEDLLILLEVMGAA